MFNSDEVSSKLKCLTNTLRDTSSNLKSLDYLALNPSNDYKSQSNYFNENKEKNNSFVKIEQSLDNISMKQNRLEDEVKRMSTTLRDDNKDIPSFLNYSRVPQKASSTNFLDTMEPITEATLSVNKKLQEAQEKLRNDRILLENRNSSFNKNIDISSDLKSLLTENANTKRFPSPIDSQQIELLTKRIIKSESENSSLKFEFDSLKRQFVNEMGAKNSLLTKMENSKSKIRDIEEESIALKKELDRVVIENEVNKKKADNNNKWQEKLSAIQWENEQLKKETRHCNHPMEIEELRRQKEKSERSRVSMKDQMSDMTKQMDSKQVHVSKLMDEVRDLQEKISLGKSKYQDLDEKFHENQNELRYRQQMYQESINKIETLEHSIIDLEANKNKGFSIKDDMIERLENQCTRMKNEIDKLNSQIQENSYLLNDLHKENESQRSQISTDHLQTDALRREMESLIKARSIQDEILKRREEDNENYRIKSKELHLLVENAEQIGEKYKFDAEIYNQELNQARETIAVKEERLSSLNVVNLSQQEQIVIFKSDISNFTRKMSCLENQISHLNKDLLEYKNRDDNIELLKRQLDELQESREKMSVDIVKKSQKFQIEKENNLKKLEQMLDAERAALKVVNNKCDRQVAEINRIHQEYWNREQLVQRFRKKYVKVKLDFENLLKQKEVEKNMQQTSFNDEIMEQEQEIKVTKERLSDVIEERDQVIRWIMVDFDGVVELLSKSYLSPYENSQLKSSSYLIKNCSIDLKSIPPTSSALSTLGGLDMSKCFLDLKSKISWLRSEINKIINHFENFRNSNTELQEDLAIANERIKNLEEEKKLSKSNELDEARQCISKLRAKEKNETNLQLKCDKLQEELHNVRQYLNDNLSDCNHLHC